jgi:hypothetical protein
MNLWRSCLTRQAVLDLGTLTGAGNLPRLFFRQRVDALKDTRRQAVIKRSLIASG